MKENIFEVLMYLFENYMIEGTDSHSDQEMLTTELTMAGFGDGEIVRAFNWLEDLSMMCDQPQNPAVTPSSRGFRFYSEDELNKIGFAGRGLLIELENRGILDPTVREMVIDRVLALDNNDVELEQLKWVVMMVICNQPGNEEIFPWAEELVLDGIEAHLH